MKGKLLLLLMLTFSICIVNAQVNFQWAKSMGGTANDLGQSVAVDANGNVYTFGTFQGTVDFDPGVGVVNLTAGPTDVFISKLDAAGNFIWVKQFEGTGSNNAGSISIDGAGNVYTIGTFSNVADFDPGAGVYSLSASGAEDVFISKLDASGNFVWAIQFGGTITDYGSSLTLDAAGNIYTTGYFQGTVDFDPGAAVYNLVTAPSATNIFVSKLDPSGNFILAEKLGGTLSDIGYSIAVDLLQNIYISGTYRSNADFDPGAGTYILPSYGFSDIFICKLNSSGAFMWANGMGASAFDYGRSVAVDAL